MFMEIHCTIQGDNSRDADSSSFKGWGKKTREEQMTAGEREKREEERGVGGEEVKLEEMKREGAVF